MQNKVSDEDLYIIDRKNFCNLLTQRSFYALNVKFTALNHFFKPDWMPPGAKLKYDQKYLKKIAVWY